MTEDFFDFSELNMKEIDNGAPIPPGWYRCRVSNVDEDVNTNAVKFEFTILAGPCNGRKIHDTLWHWANAQNDKAEKASKNRRALYAYRLGLISQADVDAKRKVSVKWTKALQRDCFVKVEHREYDKKDKAGNKTGQKGTAANVTFDGVFGVDDDRVPDDVKAEAAGAEAAPATTSSPDRTPVGAGSSNGAGAKKDYAKQFGL